MNNTLNACKVTMAGQVDASTIPSIVRDVLAPLPGGATAEDKVLALFRYARRHLFAYVGTMDDTIEVLNKALYTLNWWGFGLCGRLAKTFGMLAVELLGKDNVRQIGMRERERGAWRVGQEGRPYAFYWTSLASNLKPDQLFGHTSLEVRWDEQWHFLDIMCGFYRRDEHGRIVSLQEIMDRPELADRPVGDPDDGDMPYGPEPEIFTRSNAQFYPPGLNAWPGELPPLNLRPGESFTFLPEPIPGEFFVHPKMRAIFKPEAIDGGPREGRRNARPARYGNAEHRYRVVLQPDESCPFWCRHTADWHVPVELPYPVTSIHWEMTPGGISDSEMSAPAGVKSEIRNPKSEMGTPPGTQSPEACSGFLSFAPSTGDELLAIPAAGSHKPGPEAMMGRGYKLIVRAPGRRGPVQLALRTIVEHNALVVPKLASGSNRVRLHGDGGGKLTARLTYEQAGREQSASLAGVGEHEVLVPDNGPIGKQSITLANGNSAASATPFAKKS